MPPCGIRTHNLSRLAAADLCLRPRGHWDRQVLGVRLGIVKENFCGIYVMETVKKKLPKIKPLCNACCYVSCH